MNKHTRSVSLIDGHTEEMTDSEIIKALEWCNSLSKRCCDGCPYYEIPYKNGKRCSEMMIDDALDLINRQQAEIERYNKTVVDLNANITDLIFQKEKAKSEAIKEFWKRFDKVLCENIGPSKRVYWKISSDGNNLVKEMTE